MSIDVDECFMGFELAVAQAKQRLVTDLGACTDLAPIFCALRSYDGLNVSGSCTRISQRIELTAPNLTRWLSLCRQVVTMTGSDVALAAVERIMPQTHHDDPIEAIEIMAITPESSRTVIRPYKYTPGRFVQWMPSVAPNPDLGDRACIIEMDAARRAWSIPAGCSYHSVKYLSDACKTTWHGHPDLLDAILGYRN
jgi:hypothetical protein